MVTKVVNLIKKLVIIGAGGFGREVLGYALDLCFINSNLEWEIKGFIDDNIDALQGYDYEYEVFSTIKEHKISKEYVYICAIGDPKIKLQLCKKFCQEGAEFINIIHPSARIGRTCKIGRGVVICPNAVLTEDVKVQDFVAINCHSNCGHDSQIGKGSTISVFCDITGFVTLGEGIFLGSHASICPGNSIGDYTKIGAGAAVISDIPDNCTAVGVPARIVKTKEK